MPIRPNQSKIVDIDGIVKELQEARAAHRVKENAFFEAYLKGMFSNFSGLKKLLILGWTPGFNDGDPCVHEQQVYLTVNEFADTQDELSNYLEGSWETGFQPKEGEEHRFNAISSEEARGIALQLRNFQETLYNEEGTNWSLTFTIDANGIIQKKKDYYHPEY